MFSICVQQKLYDANYVVILTVFQQIIAVVSSFVYQCLKCSPKTMLFFSVVSYYIFNHLLFYLPELLTLSVLLTFTFLSSDFFMLVQTSCHCVHKWLQKILFSFFISKIHLFYFAECLILIKKAGGFLPANPWVYFQNSSPIIILLCSA